MPTKQRYMTKEYHFSVSVFTDKERDEQSIALALTNAAQDGHSEVVVSPQQQEAVPPAETTPEQVFHNYMNKSK